MNRDDFPAPQEGVVLAHSFTVRNYEKARGFYRDVLGGRLIFESPPFGIIGVANTWVTLNEEAGPADDRPEVTLAPPTDVYRVSGYLCFRVADIQATYEQWKSKGAEFLTPPIDHGMEIRCYMRDPDGYLIEVGQATGLLDLLKGQA